MPCEFFDDLSFTDNEVKEFSEAFECLFDEVTRVLKAFSERECEETYTSAKKQVHKVEGALKYMGFVLPKQLFNWASGDNFVGKGKKALTLANELCEIKKLFDREVKKRIE